MRITQLFAVLLFFAASIAHAQGGNIYLSQAKVFYEGNEFEKCLKRLRQVEHAEGTSRAEQVQIELYLGLCGYQAGHRDDGLAHLNAALRLEPGLELPAGTSPRLEQEFRALVPKPAPPLPPSEAALKVEPPPTAKAAETPTEAVASPPRSVRVLPIVLTVVTLGSAGAAAAMGFTAKAQERVSNDPATFWSDAQTVGQSAHTNALIANVLFGVAATAAVAAIIAFIFG